MSTTPKRRIYELDLLRGFFICVIILDHLQFWPSPLQYLTGQGRLWASAAEGFFLISGLLVGYLRAYKGVSTPLKVLSKGLLSRAAMLYVWCIVITLVVVSLSVLMPGTGELLPRLPDATQVISLPVYLWNVLTSTFASDWIYFLRLYAIMLATTPIFLWLIRTGEWWLALGAILAIYATSLLFGIEEAAMQWQVFFFGAALIGWKLEAILGWLRSRPQIRKGLIISLITLTLTTMALSYFFVHGWKIVEAPNTLLSRDAYVSVRASVDPLFSNNPMVPLRVGIAFLWFSGLLALFHVLRSWLLKYADWLLLPFGQTSLTAYCVQAIVLIFVVSYIPLTTNFWLNGLVGIATILLFAGLIRLPIVKQVFPR